MSMNDEEKRLVTSMETRITELEACLEAYVKEDERRPSRRDLESEVAKLRGGLLAISPSTLNEPVDVMTDRLIALAYDDVDALVRRDEARAEALRNLIAGWDRALALLDVPENSTALFAARQMLREAKDLAAQFRETYVPEEAE